MHLPSTRSEAEHAPELRRTRPRGESFAASVSDKKEGQVQPEAPPSAHSMGSAATQPNLLVPAPPTFGDQAAEAGSRQGIGPVDGPNARSTSETLPRQADTGPAFPRHLAADLLGGARRAEREERVELLLEPAELGRLRFELAPEGDRVMVLISVERQDTLDLLRRNAELLRAEFRDAGFGSADLSFSQWGRGSDSRPDSSTPAAAVAFGMAQAEVETPDRPTSALIRGGLDLRL